MSYIGNTPAENYASFLTETFSVSATANYTLSHAVSNENDIRLVINGVVQQPGSGKAYTASGTTLTLTSATVSGDSMYAVYLGRALQTVNPPNASVGSSQTAPTIITGQTAEATIATDDTILIHDTSASALRKMTRANFVSGIGGTNTPAFFATADGQNVSDNTYAKVNLGTEVFDVGGCFASSRFTVPSGEAGKYFLYASVRGTVDTDGQLQDNYASFYLNGSQYLENRMNFNNNNIRQATNLLHVVLDLSVGNYVELYGAVNTTSSQGSISNDLKGTNFGGYKIIE